MSTPYFTILLPPSVKNERCVQDIQSFFRKMPSACEVLNEEIIPAVLKAQGEYVFIMAPDLKVPLVEVINFFATFNEFPDLDLLVAKNNIHFKGFRKRIVHKLFENLKSLDELISKAENLGVKMKAQSVITVGLSSKAP